MCQIWPRSDHRRRRVYRRKDTHTETQTHTLLYRYRFCIHNITLKSCINRPSQMIISCLQDWYCHYKYGIKWCDLLCDCALMVMCFEHFQGGGRFTNTTVVLDCPLMPDIPHCPSPFFSPESSPVSYKQSFVALRYYSKYS